MSVQKRKKFPQENGVETGTVSATFKKALKSKSTWEDKEEFLDVIYWFRQILAILLGIVWGIVPLKGIIGIGLFCLINAAVVYVYFTSFQQIDDEDYGGPFELTKEGFMSSFALFMVLWILVYSAYHFP